MIGKHTGTNTGEFIAFLPIKHLAVRSLSVDEEAGNQCAWLSPLVPRQPTHDRLRCHSLSHGTFFQVNSDVQ